MTEEQIPTPAPARRSMGSNTAIKAFFNPIGVTTTVAITIASARRSTPARPPVAAIRCPSRNVENKQRAIHKCENVTNRLATDSHASQQKHPAARKQQSGKIAQSPHAECRQHDWSEKLNCSDCR